MSDRVIPFYSLTLGDLVYPKARLIVLCACGRESQLDVLPVLAKRGPRFGVKELEKVVTCLNCRRRGIAMVRVEWL